MKPIIKKCVLLFPVLKEYISFKQSLTSRVSLGDYLLFYIKRNKTLYWPVHNNSQVTHPKNIFVGLNTSPGTMPGCYIQGNGKIFIGDYVQLASNVGVISGNHGYYNHFSHVKKETIIGDYAWIGMGAVILPGVVLGPRTIVAANAVVTKSFLEGYCIIGGNPAKLIKKIDKEKFIKHKFKKEYYGFIPRQKFKKFREKHLQKLEFDYDVSMVTENEFYMKSKC